MKSFRLFTALVVIALCGITSPLPAQCEPEQVPIVSKYNTYYSDYFVTAVGGDSQTCENEYSSWGVLDGAYRELIWVGCCGSSQWDRRCYQKNGSIWVLISCP